eukprot:TRINITY_DN12529_c0_g1_i1.p1 TRINITY_DN12529_c0_g1~~TRINITY_DN12529_c0_g1_i1.p1  ORF type:complete len:133 (-),score=5.54 TRINITY_DN12529_c0_g1_i1:160-558(-)
MMANRDNPLVLYPIMVISFLCWLGSLIMICCKSRGSVKQELDKFVEKENKIRLHQRGLDLAVGPVGRYLRVDLHYIASMDTTAETQIIMEDIFDGPIQPFLAPPQRRVGGVISSTLRYLQEIKKPLRASHRL